MKRLTMILVLILCLVLCAAARAEEKAPEILVSGDFEYILLADGTAEITAYTGTAEELTIPAELDGRRVSSIGERAFWGCDSLMHVSISDGVSGICDEAFGYCANLIDIAIPDSVAEIGANPWVRCSSLAGILISSDHPTLDLIDGVLFTKADRTLIRYPDGRETVSYSIPDGTQSIGKFAFADSAIYNMHSVTIPESVTSIGEFAFLWCEMNSYYIFPNIIVPPDSYAEQYCIKRGLRYFRTSDIHTTGDYQWYMLADGTAEIFLYTGSNTELVIPDELEGVRVTQIGRQAFWHYSSLISVVIPDSVTVIGDTAFTDCTNLAFMSVPESVTRIEGWFLLDPDQDSTLIVTEDSYAWQHCEKYHLAYVTISHSDTYWDDEWQNPRFPVDLSESVSDDDIPPFDSDLDAVRAGIAVIDRLHDQGRFTSESLFLAAPKTGEDLWHFCYAQQPLEPGFCLCVVINGKDGSVVSAWVGE